MSKKYADDTPTAKKNPVVLIAAIAAVVCLAAYMLFTNIVPSQNYDKAVSLRSSGDYAAAVSAFKALGNYKDAAAQIPATYAAQGEALLASGDYAGAVEAFTSAGDGSRVLEVYRAQGEALLASGDYAGATEAFIAAGANEHLYETYYKQGSALAAAGDNVGAAQAFELAVDHAGDDKQSASAYYAMGEAFAADDFYTSAIEAFENAAGYSDASERIADIKYDSIRSAEPGDIVIFGAYEQDGVTANGKEQIEWLVLDFEGDEALLISLYCLDCQPYNELWQSVTWENCTMRAWLNNDFYNAAFSDDDKTRVVPSTLKNLNNTSYGTGGGSDTTDMVFLLSLNEARDFFADNDSRAVISTRYAKDMRAAVSENGNSWWWLRSPGCHAHYGANVNSNGAISFGGCNVRNLFGAVRPCVRIDIAA